MTYGTMHKITKEWLIARAGQSGITEEQLGLDPDLTPYTEGEDVIPDCLFEITVHFGGALDESFYVLTAYEFNIVDWLASQCAEESSKQEDEPWSIYCYNVIYEGLDLVAGNLRYSRTSAEQ